MRHLKVVPLHPRPQHDAIMIAPRHWQAADGLLEIFLRCSADKITIETARAQFAEFLARRFP